MTDLALDTLEARGLIRLATAQPELEYLFRHALLQDTAYESLLKQERKQLHQVVGQTLEQLYPDRVGEMAAVLARHFEQAGDNDKAVDYLTAAAKYAIERNAITEAYELYSRASAMLPEYDPAAAPELRRRRIEIELGRARAGFTFLSDEEQHEILKPLIAQAAQLGDLRLECEVGMQAGLISNSRPSLFNFFQESPAYCHRPAPRYLFFAERPVWSVTLVYGQRREVLSVDRLYGGASRDPDWKEDLPYCDCEVLMDRAYFLPLGDASWPDDTCSRC